MDARKNNSSAGQATEVRAFSQKPILDFPGLTESELAKRRLRLCKGDPFLFADWEQVLFLHFAIDPEALRHDIPAGFDLELYQGKACVSVVALTMRQFHPCGLNSTGWLLRPISEQRFLNLRTYVRFKEERGAFFLYGWLSEPFGLRLPSHVFGLPYAFARSHYSHGTEGVLCGEVTDRGSGRFAYRASLAPACSFCECPDGSLAEFAMERYTGFFSRGNAPHLFRAWHAPWLQTTVEASVEEDSLLKSKFPWFEAATLAGANFALGFKQVWLGRTHRIKQSSGDEKVERHVLSAFYDMP